MPSAKKTVIDKPKKAAPKKSTKKKKSTTPVVEEVVEEEVVEEEVVEEVAEEVADEASDEGADDTKHAKRTNRTVSRETVTEDFDSIISSIENEIDVIRSGDGKVKGVQFLRSLNSKIKKLKKSSLRIAKGKTKRTGSNNSGFLKPVSVSEEMRKFAGWEEGELHSRVDVTKFICNYIKEHDLQNKDDRRQIVPDAKLQKLLGVKKGEQLPYFKIQTNIKDHFKKDD